MCTGRPRHLAPIAFVLLCAPTGCRDPVPVILTVSVSPAEHDLNVGDTVRLSASVRDERGRSLDRPLTWSSSDSAVVTVSALGTVRGLRPGVATVTASAAGRSAGSRVTVKALAPVLDSILPSLLAVGTVSAALRVTGSHFLPSSVVLWQGMERPTTYVDSSTLTAAFSAGDLARIVVAQVAVRSPAPGGGTSRALPVVVGILPGPTAPAVSAGNDFTCGVTTDGRLYCWGSNRWGRFGNGVAFSSSAVPGLTAGRGDWARVATSGSYYGAASTLACGLTRQGAAWCWGQGALGDGSSLGSNVPVPVAGGHVFVDLAVGGRHACGVTREGAAYCWGENHQGQLGDSAVGGTEQTRPIRVPGTMGWAAVTAGSVHSCGLTREGEVFCWGMLGLLGNGQGPQVGADPPMRSPVPVSGRYARIAAGVLHTCALTSAGQPYCWGENLYGQLGDGGSYSARVPVPVAVAEPFVDIAGGYSHTCALTEAGQSWCWGANRYGQLGIGGSPSGVGLPTAVAGSVRLRSISAGTTHTCGVALDGAGYCWGYRGFGELGTGVSLYRPTPVRVAGSRSFSALAAGDSRSCAVAGDGRSYCWGDNEGGALGIGSDTGPQDCITTLCAWEPAAVSTPEPLRTISVGRSHACGLTAAGKAYCWGDNTFGQLGDGSTSARLTPVAVAAAPVFTAIAVGAGFGCALATDSTGYCWGAIAGTGDTTGRLLPKALVGALKLRSLAAGGGHACGLTAAGELYCWGSGADGQLGTAALDQCTYSDRYGAHVYPCSRVPRPASGRTFSAVVAGAAHTCALAPDGSAWCWGANDKGQLGSAASEWCDHFNWRVSCSPTPLAVPGVPALSALGAGGNHSCALGTSGELYCWGTLINAPPVIDAAGPTLLQAPALTTLACGDTHACALSTQGAAYCWGNDDVGQAGDGIAPYETRPSPVAGNLRF